jgi:cupin 2 domain-containing protein
MTLFNLFEQLPEDALEEEFQQLLRCRNVTVERITSPANSKTEWMTQEQDEWIALLQGEAELEQESETETLARGDTLFIPAGTRHRVADTSVDPCAIWLAVHIHPKSS